MQKELKKLSIEHKDYDHEALQAFKLINAGQIEQALVLLPKIEAEEEDLDHGLEKLLIEVEEFTEKAAVAAEQHEKFALKLMTIISVVAFLIGTCVSIILVRRSISRPLKEIVTGLEALNSDDMSVDVKVYNNDEIGAVAEAYVVFKENMVRAKQLEAEQEIQKANAEKEKCKVMAQLADDFDASVGDIVKTVSLASTELNTTAQSMAGISEETSNQASSIAAASEQASANVQTVASAAEEMTASIIEIKTQVAQASQISQQTVMNVDKMSIQMDELAKTADKIGDVVSMISDIAEQTNLLALNATIESARAGEAGKGFAVVASEVKSLATETAKATEEITEHIRQIQGATKAAVTSIGDIGTVVKQLEETSVSISVAMEEQGGTTQEISRSIADAATRTQELTSSLAGMTLASQETGAASEQVMSSAGELSQMSETLKSVIGEFLATLREGPGNWRNEDDPDYMEAERRNGSTDETEEQAA